MGFSERERARLVSHAPQTDRQSGSTSASSSVSYSFSGGLFGKDTGVANVGVSASYSHSNSMLLSDYSVRSDSDEYTTKHRIRMSMLSGGQPYTGWESAPSNPVLPERATSDMVIACQGIWELPDIADELEFVVAVEVTIGILLGRDVVPMLNQQLVLAEPGRGVFLPADIFGPGVPAKGLDGRQKMEFDPVTAESHQHAMTTLRWERRIPVPLGKADIEVA